MRSTDTQRRQARRYRQKYYTGKPHGGISLGPTVDLEARRANLDAYAVQSDIDRLLGVPPPGRSALDLRSPGQPYRLVKL